MKKVQIYCVTYCQDQSNLYGTLLTFKTLRIGFPDASVHVIDNGSLSSVKPTIQKHALDVGATWTSLPSPSLRHCDIVQSLIMDNTGVDPIVFLDPDLIFWQDVSAWEFSADVLVAGREIPSFHDPYTKTYTYKRLHSSFLWIPWPQSFRQKILSLCEEYFDWQPFQPAMFYRDGQWERFDMLASLYQVLLPSQMMRFTADHLDAYDHLFAGTHASIVKESIPAPFSERFADTHHMAEEGNLTELKGIWKEQDAFFAEFAQTAHVTL